MQRQFPSNITPAIAHPKRVEAMSALLVHSGPSENASMILEALRARFGLGVADRVVAELVKQNDRAGRY